MDLENTSPEKTLMELTVADFMRFIFVAYLDGYRSAQQGEPEPDRESVTDWYTERLKDSVVTEH